MHSGAAHFYEGLIRVACSAGSEDAEQLGAVDAKLELLAELARQSPATYAHKERLLAAERARLAGQDGEAIAAYEAAIDLSREHGFLHEEALAFELAGRFHHGRGRRRLARGHLRDAHYAYLRWGAAPKVERLEAEFPQLAAPQAAAPQGSKKGTRTTRRDTTTMLDLASVTKASQTISSEILQSRLLPRLLEMVVENAAARRGALVLVSEEGPRLQVRAEPAAAETVEASSEGESSQELVRCAVVEPVPLSEVSDLCVGILEYVLRTGEAIVLGDAATRESPFVYDPYVVAAQPRSVLCAPIASAGKTMAAIYLENEIAADTFTPQRLEVIQVLATQAAISLENANLFDELAQANQTLEEKVRLRTRELEEKNEQLHESLARERVVQEQVVAQKKLASLSALTAGIAHEIKNPLNFIINFASLAQDVSEELRGALADPSSADDIPELFEDLGQSIGKINEHGRRADRIIAMMIRHSQYSSATPEEVCLGRLLDRCVAQAQHEHGQVEVARDYDPASSALVLSKPLASAFKNVLDNAWWAALERARGDESRQPRVELRVVSRPDRVEVRVRDNGVGIPAANLGSVLEPFFTTRPPGSGAGLGLSLAHEIVASLHQGALELESSEGEFTEVRIQIPRGAPSP